MGNDVKVTVVCERESKKILHAKGIVPSNTKMNFSDDSEQTK